MTCTHPINAPMPGCSGCRRKRVRNKHGGDLQSPGTRLAYLIADRYENWGVKACQACSETARKMDENGADWCIRNLDQLAEEIHQNARRQTKGTGKWLDLLAYATSGLERYKSLIREACYMLPHDIMPDLHRQASDPNALQFLWMYWAPPAEGNEIYWSIASVLNHAAPARVTVFGSHPGPWYTGEHIPFTASGNVHKDRIEKMQMIANHESTAAEFVWMMDDQYFIRRTSHDQIKTPRANHRTPATQSSWGRIRTRTKNVLEAAGYRAYDYATHAPHYIEKAKLQSVFKQFNFNPPLLWETVYGCVHRNNPKPPTPYFCRVRSKQNTRDLLQESRSANVLNHADKRFDGSMVDAIRTLLGEKVTARKPVDRKIKMVNRSADNHYFRRGVPRREPEVLATIERLLAGGGVFYDIGANVGFHSLLAKQSNPSVAVHAFEPCRDTFRELQENIVANRLDIHPHNLGLSDRQGKATLHLSAVRNTQHSLSRTNSKLSGATEQVQLTTLDSMDLPPPTLMKIDVELHEMEMLRGARKTIKRHRPRIIIEIRRAKIRQEEIARELNGYTAEQIDGLNWLFTPPAGGAGRRLSF